MARSNKTNPVQLRHGMAIGTGNAETDDDFLFECFVHHPAVSNCTNVNSPGSIALGRTGSGKTAIIRYIESKNGHATNLDPVEMSMNYVANSDAIGFLNSIGADLDLLFQVLWKHVLCIEYIRLRWKIDTPVKSRNIFNVIVGKFHKDERKKRAINYLRLWEGKFWITMDENIKQITEQIEEKLKGDYGAQIESFKTQAGYEKTLSKEQKREIISRVREIINVDQLRELHGIIEMLSDSSSIDESLKCYILIDRLDDKWVDESIRFKLIRSLISSLRQFRSIKNLKILVSLRNDILERAVQESSDITFQREKFEDYIIKIKWSRNDLKELVNMRIRSLFRRQYTNKDVDFYDVFTNKVKNKDPFDYILERTHMRPRDVISFINECIESADGSYEITPNQIYKAEIEYSRKRRDALEQEWKSAFPCIDIMLKFITSFRQIYIDWDILHSSSALDDAALEVCAAESEFQDSVYVAAQAMIENKAQSRTRFLQSLISNLYRTGVVGVKVNEGDKFLYSHIDEPLISADILGSGARVRIHAMLHGAYRLNDGFGSRSGQSD